MEAVGLFHSLARGALRAKRWLAGRKTVDAVTILEYENEVALATPVVADGLAWTSDLARIAHPPRGRIMDLVFARVARTMGTTEREARRLVFGPPRRGRLAGRAR